MSIAAGDEATTTASTTTPSRSGSASTGHLFGPVSDFMMLGGISLLLFPVLLLLPSDSFEPFFIKAVVVVALVINNPHFAISYQIFYADFGRKTAPASSSDPSLRYRYLIAGVIVPIVLAVVLVTPLLLGEAEVLAYGYNVMVFFVGWHYVKQGYGMAMVDAANKRSFFDAAEKKVLLVNAYAAWLAQWVIVNRYFDREDFIDLPIKMIPVSDLLLTVVLGALALSSIATGAMLVRRVSRNQATAWTGVTAYLISLYLWMVLVSFNPLILLVAPALHSLQYLYVVKRFQMNRHDAGQGRSWRAQYWSAAALALAMFWVVPIALDTFVSYDEAALGPLAFLFVFLIGINVHHYFMDNVMWRRGNPEVSQHLFGR